MVHGNGGQRPTSRPPSTAVLTFWYGSKAAVPRGRCRSALVRFGRRHDIAPQPVDSKGLARQYSGFLLGVPRRSATVLGGRCSCSGRWLRVYCSVSVIAQSVELYHGVPPSPPKDRALRTATNPVGGVNGAFLRETHVITQPSWKVRAVARTSGRFDLE